MKGEGKRSESRCEINISDVFDMILELRINSSSHFIFDFDYTNNLDFRFTILFLN